MTAFWVGDIPSEDLVVDPARNGEAINLTAFDSVDVLFHDPDGELVESSGFLATIVDEQVIVEWPDDTVLTLQGVYELTLILESSGGFRETLAPVRIIVQASDGWHSLDSARDGWQDAPSEDDLLWELLTVARDAVEEFAPKLEVDERVPARYRKGQLMQARNLWNSDDVSPSGDEGMGSYAVQPRPLDWAVKQVIRPRSAVPVMW